MMYIVFVRKLEVAHKQVGNIKISLQIKTMKAESSVSIVVFVEKGDFLGIKSFMMPKFVNQALSFIQQVRYFRSLQLLTSPSAIFLGFL